MIKTGSVEVERNLGSLELGWNDAVVSVVFEGLEKEIHSQSNAESGMGDVMLDNRIYG